MLYMYLHVVTPLKPVMWCVIIAQEVGEAAGPGKEAGLGELIVSTDLSQSHMSRYILTDWTSRQPTYSRVSSTTRTTS